MQIKSMIFSGERREVSTETQKKASRNSLFCRWSSTGLAGQRDGDRLSGHGIYPVSAKDEEVTIMEEFICGL